MKVLYISDQKFYTYNNKWYTTASFPIDKYIDIFKNVEKWTFYGRLYDAENITNLYEVDTTLNQIEFKGIYSQPSGLIGYIFNLFPNIKILKKEIKENDIIWLKIFFINSYLAYIFGNLKEKKIITQMVGDIDASAYIKKGKGYAVLRFLGRKIYRKIAKFADLNLYVSNDLKNRYGENINNAVVSNECRVSISDIDELSYVNKRNSYFNILFIGRLSEEKGIFDLLNAINGIQNKKNIRLTILGDGRLKRQVSEYISINNLEDIVSIDGYISWGNELFKIIRKHHVLVLPSYTEGLPLVLIEAMSNGVPVIASNVGGIPEIVGKNNGLLFEAGNIKELRRCITYMMENENERVKMAKNSIDVAKNNTIESQLNIIKKFTYRW